MELGRGCRKLSPGPSSHANICRRRRVCGACDDENSRFRHDEQCVNTNGDDVSADIEEGVRGAMMKARGMVDILLSHHNVRDYRVRCSK